MPSISLRFQQTAKPELGENQAYSLYKAAEICTIPNLTKQQSSFDVRSCS
jgi:hypothetical protein